MTAERMPNSLPEVVTDQNRLDALCRELREAGRFAFDTEFVKEESYDAHLCLLQVATDDRVAIVDPLVGLDTRGLWDLIVDENVQIIVHAGHQDLELAFRITGQTPRRVFDVQIAAGLISVDYPLNLEKLVKLTVGVRLNKAQTRTDWRQRPLSAAQLKYAAEDVAYLLSIHARQVNRLQALGRMEWAEEEFARFEQPDAYQHPETEAYLRIRGIRNLDREALAILRELTLRRIRLAQELNRPARGIIRDDLLVEIAKHKLATPTQIRTLRGIYASQHVIEVLADAVQTAVKLPPDQRPALIKWHRESPQEIVLLELLSAAAQAHCLHHNVAFSLLAAKTDLRQLLEAHLEGTDLPRHAVLNNGWRRAFVAQLLLDLLDGKRHIRIGGTGRDLTVHIA
jgi:ribonuclease D